MREVSLNRRALSQLSTVRHVAVGWGVASMDELQPSSEAHLQGHKPVQPSTSSRCYICGQAGKKRWSAGVVPVCRCGSAHEFCLAEAAFAYKTSSGVDLTAKWHKCLQCGTKWPGGVWRTLNRARNGE